MEGRDVVPRHRLPSIWKRRWATYRKEMIPGRMFEDTQEISD
jgi:hypothetical protein